MFRKKFSEEMLNIKANDESKANLLKKMEEEKELRSSLKVKKSVKKRWISVLAAAVALVIVSVSVFNLPIFDLGNLIYNTDLDGENVSTIHIGGKTVDFPVIEHQKGIPASVTHNEIYKLFSAIYKADKLRTAYTAGTDKEFNLFVNEDEVEEIIEEDTAEDINTDIALKGEGNLSKPSDGATDDDKEDFSTTNTQVEDVDEADVVKTDGKYIYALNAKELKVGIAKAENGILSKISSINLLHGEVNQKYYGVSDMYLCGERLLAIYENYSKEKSQTVIDIYNISAPENPTIIHSMSQSGNYLSSRIIAGKLYIFTNEYFYENPDEKVKSSYLPCTAIDGDAPSYVEAGCIYMFDGEVNRSYLTVSSVDIEKAEFVDTKTALGGGTTLYANTKNFYVTAEIPSFSYLRGDDADVATFNDKTRVMRFEVLDGKITAMAEGEVTGTPLNQFSMDEYKDHFRIVTTGYNGFGTVNSVYILDKELKTVGSITNIAKGERVYSVRFMGDMGYFVTFRQTDPLFAVDLSDPKEPKILSALKIPGFSNYLHPWDNGLLLGIGSDADEKTGRTGNVKLSMFDISDPNNVTEKNKFIASVADSSVGTNHKSVLVSKPRNLIAFPIKDEYCVYGYNSESGFELKATLNCPPLNDMYYYGEATRGIYIGDYMYICNYNGIISYKLSDFSEVDTIIF